MSYFNNKHNKFFEALILRAKNTIAIVYIYILVGDIVRDASKVAVEVAKRLDEVATS